MSAWTNHWSPGRQIYRWSPRSCKERQGKPPLTNSSRGVPQDRRWRTNLAHPCENSSIQVAQESLYYRVAVAVAARCISWDNNSANVRWWIAFVIERDYVHLSIFSLLLALYAKIRVSMWIITMLKISNIRGNWKKSIQFCIYCGFGFAKLKKKKISIVYTKTISQFCIALMILCPL